MIKILIIGKKSFIGSNLQKKLSLVFKTDIFSFSEAMKLNSKKINLYTHVINTTIHRNYVKRLYDQKYDLDKKFIKKFDNHKFIYFFLNSRKIYKLGFNLKEKSKIQPINNYEKNKIITEKFLQKKLRKKFLSLRISNVIGLRLNNSSRRGHKIFLDNFLEYRKKNKKQIVMNDYKDFISVDQLAMIFEKLIKKNISGIYNVSLGKKVYISEIVYWLDKKFYNKLEFKKSRTDSFTLSNKKLSNKLRLDITKNQLRKFCENLLTH